MKKLNTNLLKETSVGHVEQRVQLNTEKSLTDIEKAMQDSPSLFFEEEKDGTIKPYENKEYEIFHDLGRECKAISVAYSDGLVQIFTITEANPTNMDRNKFVRIRVMPIMLSASTLIEDNLGIRRLKFWVN